MDKFLNSKSSAPQGSLMDLLQSKNTVEKKKDTLTEWKDDNTFTASDLQSIPLQPKQNTATKVYTLHNDFGTSITHYIGLESYKWGQDIRNFVSEWCRDGKRS